MRFHMPMFNGAAQLWATIGVSLRHAGGSFDMPPGIQTINVETETGDRAGVTCVVDGIEIEG